MRLFLGVKQQTAILNNLLMKSDTSGTPGEGERGPLGRVPGDPWGGCQGSGLTMVLRE